MKNLTIFIALLLLLVPLSSRAETVSIDPPAEPVVVVSPDVAISLTPTPTSARRGQDIRYSLTITNRGNVAISNLRATFDLPAGFSFSGGTSPSALKKLGDLAVGASLTKTFTLTVGTTVTPGRVPLELLISANEFDTNESIAVVTVQAGEVLGAETLVETGNSPITIVVVGLGAIITGLFLSRRLVRD